MFSNIDITQIINIAAYIIIAFGIIFLVIIISLKYLNSIFSYIDGILKTETTSQYVPASGLLIKHVLIDIASKNSFSKRAVDLVGVTLSLLLFFPLLLLTALAVKLSSPGPILFRQKRIGKDGKDIYVYKFRTMKLASEDKNFSKETMRNLGTDFRITKIGGFLRKTSIDELPMLANIFFGDMSLVGTSVASDYSDYPLQENIDPAIRDAILSVKPGLISLWVLSGNRWRNNVDTRVYYDFYYVTHQSLFLDLSIMIRVIPSILGRAGSY